MITTRIFGKKVTGKSMYQCLVKAVGFFPKVDKTTTMLEIEKQIQPRQVNYLGLHVDRFLVEKANNKNRS